ncbi:hypothetical protein VitviT2T_004476 [Vitis vinifera]|uniref:Uncharacterized protein n=1 Tax=Vitis vinifera TaxID=29760 RepID=A0ABY9BPK7_VITVI|nr:hypothetical protein VitviT2T_004476 [Vitis vinifera]
MMSPDIIPIKPASKDESPGFGSWKTGAHKPPDQVLECLNLPRCADYCVITAEALGIPTCDLSASAKGLGLTRMSVMSFLVAMALAAAVVRHRLL